MTKQIEVLKELPWAKKGDRFSLETNKSWIINYPNGVLCMHWEILLWFVGIGWIKLIDDKKTLSEKLCSSWHKNGCLNNFYEYAEICRQHFLEALPYKEYVCENEEIDLMTRHNLIVNMCRKAIREVE